MDKVVAYQGVKGAYSYIVAGKLFPGAKLVGCVTFRDVFEMIKSKQADKAVVPIENSIVGSVAEVEELLFEYRLPVLAETSLAIEHQLLVLPGAKDINEIKFVHSHPKALEQCEAFLKEHLWMTAIAEFDTAGSAELVAKKHDPTHAAIASREAGELWGLKSLLGTIQSNLRNYTKFGII